MTGYCRLFYAYARLNLEANDSTEVTDFGASYSSVRYIETVSLGYL